MVRRLMLAAGCLAFAVPAVVVPTEAASFAKSGVTGRAVTIVCPGAAAADQTCPRRPVRATIQVLRLPSKRRAATVHSNNAGSFNVDLPPGAYEVTGTTTSSSFAAAPVRTTVYAGKFARVTITFAARHPPSAASVAR